MFEVFDEEAHKLEGIDWLGHDDQAIPDNRLLPKATEKTASQNGAHPESATTAAP